MKSIYNVPVIPQNLRNDETIVQIAEALNYLSDVANDIFYRVNDRISRNNSKINVMNDRITVVSNKINNLEESGANKATRVFSSSKYPAVDVNKKYSSIFKASEVLPIKRYSVKYESSPPVDSADNLQIYHVKKYGTHKMKLDGLGKVPKKVTSVNDLLLFNSGINIYDNYVFSDTLRVPLNQKQVTAQDISEIGDAPISITDRSSLMKFTGDTYFYAPDLGDVPTIDLPLDLPNLPGIADDVRYVNESGPTIAPSVSFNSNLQEQIISKEPKPADTTEIELPPPPPVEEPPESIVPPEVQLVEPIVEPKATEIKVEQKAEVPAQKIQIPVDNNDAHASLMEAIRKAGGSKNAKLKSTEVQKAEQSQVNNSEDC